MPSTSKKQHNLMAAVAHNPAFAKKVGIPQSVGEEFTKADKGRKFSRGGEMAESKKMMDMKKGGKAKCMAKGGSVKASAMGKVTAGGKRPHGEHTVQQKGHTRAMMPKMKRGGKC